MPHYLYQTPYQVAVIANHFKLLVALFTVSGVYYYRNLNYSP